MKKEKFFRVMMMLIMASCATLFTACSDEEGDNGNNTSTGENSLKAINISYDIEVLDDYIQFFDVKVTHGFGSDSTGVTEDMLLSGWNFSTTLDAGSVEIPSRYFCKVVATPKDSVISLVNDTAIYKLGCAYSLHLQGVMQDGTKNILSNSSNRSTFSLKGEKLKKLLEMGEERVLVEFDKTVEL